MAINYKPVGWDTTKYVNPSNMNQMDDGIKAACDGVDALNAEVEAVNAEVETLNADVEAVNAEVEAVNSNLQSEINKINSSFVSSTQGSLAGLVNNGQMWLITAQRITLPDSAMFIAHGWNDKVYIQPIYKDSSMDYYVNNQGTITVTYGGDAGNVLISAIRLH